MNTNLLNIVKPIIGFLRDNWLSILQIVIIPLVTVFWTKKTICLQTADDVIKLGEYKDKKRDEKNEELFNRKLYKKCFINQKKYKGWCMCKFQESAGAENGWFMVTNKNGEYRKINFPQGILVGRYSPSNNKSIYYAPNPIEQFFINLKFKKEERSDLAELITIKQLGTNALLLMLKKQTIPKMTDTLYEPPSTSLSAAFNADAASILGRSK